MTGSKKKKKISPGEPQSSADNYTPQFLFSSFSVLNPLSMQELSLIYLKNSAPSQISLGHRQDLGPMPK